MPRRYEEVADYDTDDAELEQREQRPLPPRPRACCVLARRHQLCLLCTLSGALVNSQRIVLAIALVRMQAVKGWDKEVQGWLLSGFYLGYFCMQVPGGLMTTRFRPRWLIAASVALSAVFTLAVPAMAGISPSMLYGARVLQGVAQGPWSSSLAALWSAWSPPNERSMMDASPQAGQFFGALVFGALAGAQCDNPDWPLLGGWQGVFYLQGVLGCLWVGCWVHFSADLPTTDRRCSASERRHIAESIQAEVQQASVPASSSLAHDSGSTSPSKAKVSRRPSELAGLELAAVVMRSSAMWAIILVGVASSFTIFVLEDGLPSYMRDVAGLSLTEVGVLASLPAFVKGCLTLLAAWAADWLRAGSSGGGGTRSRAAWTTARVRKSFQAVSIGPQGVILATLAFGAQSSPNAALAMLVATDCLSGFKYGGGASVNHLDIAPHLAGVIQGVKNGIGQAVAFVVPLVIGYLTPYPGGLSREQFSLQAAAAAGAAAGMREPLHATGVHNTSSTYSNDAHAPVIMPSQALEEPPASWVREMQGEWRRVFLIAALMDALGLAIYLGYGQGERQWWDVAAATHSRNTAARSGGGSRAEVEPTVEKAAPRLGDARPWARTSCL